jgi:hypothetical protein
MRPFSSTNPRKKAHQEGGGETALSSKMVWNNSTLGAWASGDLTIDTIIQYAITFAQCATGSATYESNLSVTRLQ